MIRVVAIQTLQQYIFSFRFAVCFIITVLLVAVCMQYQSSGFRERQQEYYEASAQSRAELSEIEALSFLCPVVHRPPHPGSLLSSGFLGRAGTRVQITQHPMPYRAESVQESNEFAGMFSSFDLPSVVMLLFGLTALLISFNSISG